MQKIKTLLTNKYFYFAIFSLTIAAFCLWFIRKKQDLYLLLILFFIFMMLYLAGMLIKYFVWGFLVRLTKRIPSLNFKKIFDRRCTPWYLNIRINSADNQAIFVGALKSQEKIGNYFDVLRHEKYCIAEFNYLLSVDNILDESWRKRFADLKNHVGRHALKGIILSYNVCDIKYRSEEIEKNNIILLETIKNVYQIMGYRLPIHILVTGSDQIDGFKEYFSLFTENEREKIWGFNFNSQIFQQREPRLCQGMKILYGQLLSPLVNKVTFSNNTAKLLVCEFIENFRQFGDVLYSCFAGMLDHDAACFCGIYFIGASDKISYFSKKVFCDCILPNLMAFKYSANNEKIWLRFRIVNLICCAVFSAIFIFTLSQSFYKNIALIKAAPEFVDNLSQCDDLYDGLRDLYLYDQALINNSHTFGAKIFYILSDKQDLLLIIKKLLLKTMTENYLTSLQEAVVQQLLRYEKQWDNTNSDVRQLMRGDYYVALESYLALTSLNNQFNESTYYELGSLWAKNWQLTDLNLLNFYLSHLSECNREYLQKYSLPQNQLLINRARQQLYTTDDAENLYARLRYVGLRRYGEIGIDILLHSYGRHLLITDSDLPAIATSKIWDNYFTKEIEKLCTLKSDSIMNQPLFVNDCHVLQLRLKDLYITDQIALWNNFLNGLHLKPFQSLQDAILQMNILVGQDSPILQLLQILQKNLQQTQNNNLRSFEFTLDNVIYREKSHAENLENDKNYLHDLLAINDDLQGLAASVDASSAAQSIAIKLLKNPNNELSLQHALQSSQMIAAEFSKYQMSDAVNQLLTQPVREVWRVILQMTAANLQKDWQEKVVNFYQQRLMNYFPFSANSSADVTLSDVDKFFHPQSGILSSFISQSLATYLQADQTKLWLGIGINFSPEFLQALAQLQDFMEILYSNSASSMGFSYEIVAVPHIDVSEIDFSAQGQNYRYRNGPQISQILQWSPNNPDQENALTIHTINGIAPETLHFNGSWSLFRLLKAGHAVSAGDDSYKVTWQLNRDQFSYPISLIFRMPEHWRVIQRLLSGEFVVPARMFE